MSLVKKIFPTLKADDATLAKNPIYGSDKLLATLIEYQATPNHLHLNFSYILQRTDCSATFEWLQKGFFYNFTSFFTC